jgi:hypothetical protein
MAAASYNLGQGIWRSSSAAETNYFDLLLPEEPRATFPRTGNAVHHRSGRYGFICARRTLPPYHTHAVTASAADLNAFANANVPNYKTLKLLNPWLRDNILTDHLEDLYRAAAGQGVRPGHGGR